MPVEARCVSLAAESRIKVEEKGRKAVILNLKRQDHRKIKVDGCVVRASTAADWVIEKVGVGSLIVELKGTDVDHALVQIEATAKFWRDEQLIVGKFGALVVCVQYPAISSSIQRAMARFRKTYGAPLLVVSRNLEHDFDKLVDG